MVPQEPAVALAQIGQPGEHPARQHLGQLLGDGGVEAAHAAAPGAGSSTCAKTCVAVQPFVATQRSVRWSASATVSATSATGPPVRGPGHQVRQAEPDPARAQAHRRRPVAVPAEAVEGSLGSGQPGPRRPSVEPRDRPLVEGPCRGPRGRPARRRARRGCRSPPGGRGMGRRVVTPAALECSWAAGRFHDVARSRRARRPLGVRTRKFASTLRICVGLARWSGAASARVAGDLDEAPQFGRDGFRHVALADRGDEVLEPQMVPQSRQRVGEGRGRLGIPRCSARREREALGIACGT